MWEEYYGTLTSTTSNQTRPSSTKLVTKASKRPGVISYIIDTFTHIIHTSTSHNLHIPEFAKIKQFDF